MGGLGNQLFQYAFGVAQRENGAYVKYDMSFYDVTKKQKWPRPYLLDKFNTCIRPCPFISEFKNIRESKVGFDLNLLKADRCNFDGYWQYLEYYKGILPILQKELVLKPEYYTSKFSTIKNHIESTNSVSLHVRRGDYIVQTWGILPKEYYFNAFAEMHDIQNKHYFIFSDDIEWCKQTFKSSYFTNDVTFVDLQDYLSFELMSLCKHQIIASSTFSWWAAFLNSNDDKIVIAPSKWLGGEKKPEIIYPKDWRIIHVD